MFLFAYHFFLWYWRSFHFDGDMTADTCDYEELENGLPEKKDHLEQFTGGWLSLEQLAGLLSGLIMYYVGFSADVQPEGALTGLR